MMKRLMTLIVTGLMTLPLIAPTARAQGAPRERLLMDCGWKFHFGNAADPAQDFGYSDYASGSWSLAKASQSLDVTAVVTPSRGGRRGVAGGGGGRGRGGFTEADWTSISLPHDWATELAFEQRSPTQHGAKPLGRTYPATSIGWYRRTFQLTPADKDKRITVEFDGVFRECVVWVNKNMMGRHQSGYSSFRYDITDYLNFNGPNVITVRVDATAGEGWFYEGAGIYRHVWLVKTNPLHIAPDGVFSFSTVSPDFASADVSARTSVVNEGDKDAPCTVVTTLRGADGRQIGTVASEPLTLKPAETRELTQRIPVSAPKLWSPETPNLYTLTSEIKSGETLVDTIQTNIGIRTVAFDAEKGFILNGKPCVIKGTSNHQDHAGVGVALPDRVNEFRIEKLKEMGDNAYRCSHNPPTPELLDACDRLGMLVLDENRMMGSTPEFAGVFESLIRRDRNHPCIFLWSIGNEEWNIQGTETGRRLAKSLVALAHRLDPTRLATHASNNGAQYEGINQEVDVRGWNYHTKNAEPDGYHKAHPAQPNIGTETAASLGSRGVYTGDRTHIVAYDTASDFGTTAEEWWTFYAARPWMSGGFAWTGFDYRGEPTPFGWPAVSSHFGILDLCGFPKDNYYYYQAWWSDKPVLHIYPHWNWPGREGQEIDVWVQSNFDEVELFLNGQSQGKKVMKKLSHLSWMVKYTPGTLEAKGYKGGQAVASAKVETTGAPVAVKLTADRATIKADGEDVSMIRVAAVDDKGREVPTAANEISFTVSKNGRNIGVGNGDPSSLELDKATKRKLFSGLAQLIVQSTPEPGPIEVQAGAPGLTTATLTLKAEPCALRPQVK